MASNTTRVIGGNAIPGCVVAMALSYAINKSILWGVLHMFLGWGYVLYWLFTYTNFDAWVNSWVGY